MTEYSFAPKGDHLTIFKGKKKVHTPNGNVVIAYSEDRAKEVIKELEKDEDYTSCASLLCYHYTYCDLIAQYQREDVANDLTVCLEDNLEQDPLLMFRQGDTDAGEVVETLMKEIKGSIPSLSMEQMVAMIVIYCSFDSFALSWGIIKGIIEASHDSRYISLKEQFVSELREFCKADEDLDCPKKISGIIDAFVSYYK